jgi:hypothetical protein
MSVGKKSSVQQVGVIRSVRRQQYPHVCDGYPPPSARYVARCIAAESGRTARLSRLAVLIRAENLVDFLCCLAIGGYVVFSL